VAGAQARFEFLSTSGQTILEIETNREAHSGRIDFLDGGRNVLGLVMRGAQENHEGAIYLGDSERQGRIALGAIGTDIGGAPTEEWGLAVTSPHSGKINVLVQSDRTQRPRVIFGAIEADGTGRAVSSK
jgi:hypothetical protein